MKFLKDIILEKFELNKNTKASSYKMIDDVMHMMLLNDGFEKSLFEYVLQKQSNEYNFNNIQIFQYAKTLTNNNTRIYYGIYKTVNSKTKVCITNQKDYFNIKLVGGSYNELTSNYGAVELLKELSKNKQKYFNFSSSIYGRLTLKNLYMWPSSKDYCIKVYLTNESFEELQKQNFFK